MTGLPFSIGAIIFGGAAVGLIGLIRSKTGLKEDAVIGIVFTSFFALGLVLVSITPSTVDLNHIIFGNLLGVDNGDMYQVLILAAVACAVLLLFRKSLALYAFDPTHAFAIGVSPRVMQWLLLGILAVTTVVALQVVGVILVVALLIIPGACARLLVASFWKMLWVAPLLSVTCTAVGLHLSFYLNVASGGMIVLTHSVAFVCAWARSALVKSRRARVAVG